jgi:hypothetical protein
MRVGRTVATLWAQPPSKHTDKINILIMYLVYQILHYHPQ